MGNLTINPYEQLADYFKKENDQKIKNHPIDTKKILQESKFHGFIPATLTKRKSSSLGFDVDKFENMMRSKLIEEHKKRQSYERAYISVSELYTCLRQCYYNRMKYDIDLNKQYKFSYLFLIQRIGDEIHKAIQELYDFSETEKTVISEKYKVKGRVDAIKDNFVYDIKSIDDTKFKDEYIHDHYLQCLIYAYILNTEYNYQLNTITIIYVLRGLKKIYPIDLQIDNNLAKSLLNRAPILLNSLKNKKVLDPIGATIDSCTFCVFKEQCKKDSCIKIHQPFNTTKAKNEIFEIKEDDDKIAFLL